MIINDHYDRTPVRVWQPGKIQSCISCDEQEVPDIIYFYFFDFFHERVTRHFYSVNPAKVYSLIRQDMNLHYLKLHFFSPSGIMG